MNFHHWFSSPAWLTLVRALLHTLWLGALAAGGLAVALRVVPVQCARQRYGLCVAALLGVLLAGIGAWGWLDAPVHAGKDRTLDVPSRLATRVDLPSGQDASPSAAASTALPFQPDDDSVSPERELWGRIAVAGWLAGVAVGLWRIACGVAGAGRLCRHCQPLTDPVVLAWLEELRACLGLRRPVRLLVSTDIAVPMVMGIVRPAILLPAALLSGVPAEALHAVLAHELAHVRRWDYLVNLGQLIVETLLFFNPFVWWISRQMRLEREACCDQLAAMQCRSPAHYVESLLAVVEYRHGAMSGPPAPMLAADGPEGTGKGGVLDRSRRLLVPGYLPALRVRWYSLAAVLLLSGGTLAALFLGARTAFRALTPQERVQRIAELTRAYAPPVFPQEPVTVSGRVDTADGTPLDGPVRVAIHSQMMPDSSSATQLETRPDGTFSVKSKCGLIHLAAFREGYAPAFLGPIDTNRGKPTELRITLGRGFAASIQTVDENGQPVGGARITGYYTGPATADSISLTTGADGVATLAHAAAVTLGLQAEADGYQSDDIRDFRPDPARTFRWVLKKTRPLDGTVASAATGQPVEGARIKLAKRYDSPLNLVYEPSDAPVLTRSDHSGCFVLDHLRPDSRYAIYVEAPGFGGIMRDGIRVDGPPLAIAMGPELSVHGKVLQADPPPGGTEIRLEYGQTFKFGEQTNTFTHERTLTLRNGQADFALELLFAAPLEIYVGGQTIKLAASELPKTDLRIDLAAAVRERKLVKTRSILFRLHAPRNAPVPTGSIWVGYQPLDSLQQGTNLWTSRTVPIENGVAKLDVGLPNKLDYFPTGLIGYTFDAQNNKVVGEGSDPLTIDVPVRAAGAIFGEVQTDDGLPIRGLWVNTHVIQPPDHDDGFRVQDVQCQASDLTGNENRFTVGPLPLGRQYAVVARRNMLFAVSQPMRLDEAAPIRRIKLVLPKGRTVQGQMLDETGRPAAEVPFILDYGFPGSNGAVGMSFSTDHDGHFSIPQVGSNVPGSYHVRIISQSRYQPKIVPWASVDDAVAIRLQTGKTLAGTLVDEASGNPVAGAGVYAQYADDSAYEKDARILTPGILMFDAEAASDEQGRFRFSDLPDAKVFLWTREVNPADLSHRLVVTPGQPEPVTFKVKMIPGSAARVVPPK